MADKPVTVKDFQALQKQVDELEKAVKALKKSTEGSFDERKEEFKLEKVWTHAMFDQYEKILGQHAELINKLRDKVFN
jgi:hypothetical protein